MRLLRNSALVIAGLAMAGAVSAQALRIGFADPLSSLDPQLNNHAGDQSVSQHFWLTLVQQRQGKLLPGIASSWTNLDPLTWEFKIDPKARWSDDKPVTADDVAFSYQRARNVPGSAASYAGFLRTVQSATAKDSQTLVIKTTVPNPDLPLNLTSVYVVSKHVGEKATTDDYNAIRAMVTSGPYKAVSYVPGERVMMAANPAYAGPKPAWDQVNYRHIVNPAARTAALLAGDVDVIDKVSVGDMARLMSNPKVSVYAYDGLRVLMLLPNHNPASSPFVTDAAGKALPNNPLANPKVREALSMAINRRALVDRVLQGGATEANQWMPRGTFGYNPALKNIPYDPEAAKKLLAEAGYPQGFQLLMHVPGERYPLGPETAQAIAQFWTRIGVNTKVEVIPFSVYVGRAGKGEYAMSMIGWGNGTGEASYGMVQVLATHDAKKGLGANNWGRHSNPAMDKALAEATTEFDANKREAHLREGARAVMSEAGILPLFHYRNIWAARRDLKVVPWNSDRTVAMQVSPVAASK